MNVFLGVGNRNALWRCLGTIQMVTFRYLEIGLSFNYKLNSHQQKGD